MRDFLANPTLGSALDLAEVQPDVFAGAPEILVPLATELLVRGAFERGSRAFALAQQAGVDPDRQPELAVKLALVSSLYCAGHRATGRVVGSPTPGAAAWRHHVVGLDEWLVGLDMVAMYCHTYLGDFSTARRARRCRRLGSVEPSRVTEVLCPGVISQVALAEGALNEAARWPTRAIASARRLGFEPDYFASCALRTAALLALERHDLGHADAT